MNRELYTRPDQYVKKSRACGYRSRAAWKLIEIDDKHHITKNVKVALDLGCCPGSWLQVLREKIHGQVVGIDIQETEPIRGVTILHGDIKEHTQELQMYVPQLIVSDMAPNTSGSGLLDHQCSMELAYIALNLAEVILETNGSFLCKIFSGADENEFVADVKKVFKKVVRVKLASSKYFSKEIYILGLNKL